jgi:formamidopyrimidine-DNA glycosylase
MPELPEVETVVRGLQTVLPGRRILSVQLGKTDFIDDPEAVQRMLPGSRIESVRRHGKFLVFDLERSGSETPHYELLIHLGMTGRIVTCPPEARVDPHTHVFVALDDGREMRYTDVRRFGRIRILANGDREKTLGVLGQDPLEVSEADFHSMVRARDARIKALLLDQHFLRGVGNIYADESLWRARIHPMRVGATLSDVEIGHLYRAIRHVLREAIRFRGSSISDYVDARGERGGFQQRHRVYQRQGKKCIRCGAIIRHAIVAGRSTHFCPRCQRAPRARRPRKRG